MTSAAPQNNNTKNTQQQQPTNPTAINKNSLSCTANHMQRQPKQQEENWIHQYACIQNVDRQISFNLSISLSIGKEFPSLGVYYYIFKICFVILNHSLILDFMSCQPHRVTSGQITLKTDLLWSKTQQQQRQQDRATNKRSNRQERGSSIPSRTEKMCKCQCL